MSDPEQAGLSKLVQDLEDGVITREDRDILMEMLRADPEARGLYLKHIRLAALLRQTAETRGELGTIPVSQEMLRRSKRISAWTAIAWGVAAVLAVALGLMLFKARLGFGSGHKEIAWDVSQDARYRIKREVSDHRGQYGTLRPGDRIALERGLLQLEFPSGVEAIVEGPADMEMLSGTGIRLDGGMSWFRVPESGKGFAVETGIARVVDLGTQFGLRFDGGDSLQVHVGKGRVRIEPEDSDGDPFELAEGKAVRLGREGDVDKIAVQPDFFRRKFTRQIPYIHWAFDRPLGNSYPAAGIMPGVSGFGAEIRAADGGEIGGQDLAACRTDGVQGGAFSMNGRFFAESAFPGIGGSAPRTIAAWIRHRGGDGIFPSPGTDDPRDDPYPGYGVTTPFGEQAFLINYGNTGITTAAGATGESLEPDTAYGLDFHVAARPGLPKATYRVELVAFPAGTGDEERRDHSSARVGTVVAYAEGEASAHDMSGQDRISFSVGRDHPNLGDELAIRLVHKGDLVPMAGKLRHSGRVLFDNLRLSKTAGGDTRLVFSEDFETPRVAGYARGVPPATGWVGRGRGSGLFNHHPPFQNPYLSWGNMEQGRMWAGFVENLARPAPCTATGVSWLRGGSSPALGTGEWVHVATVHTGGLNSDKQPEIIHYIDGKRVESHPASSAFSGTLDTAAGADRAASLRFGALSGDAPVKATWNGDIDECFIFRGALDAEEIGRVMEYHSPHFLEK